jgi:hypothetical protein
MREYFDQTFLDLIKKTCGNGVEKKSNFNISQRDGKPAQTQTASAPK